MNRHAPLNEPQDFRRLILPHLDGAYDLARYLTRDPVLSEDVVQDAVLRAFRAFGQFRGASPRAWLFAIVRNCCRTAQARSGGGLSLVVADDAVDERPDNAPNPEESAARQSDIERVRAAIEAIPEPFREAVVLRDLEDLSYAEIAEVTGVPVGTVMSRLSRGRGLLAKELLPVASTESDQSRSVK
ncbi:MAG TPA: sigma-70 family RNA polymerase sigma factor [Sphingomicrobium sp.]|nr:sigma-70 family RNA polymerase sigma factor [Sphingomicrobium sp.]